MVNNTMTTGENEKMCCPTGKVLIMDDDEVIRSAIGNLLVNIGYEVETCGDGWEVLKVYEKALRENSPFDAVILDIIVSDGLGGKKTMQKLLDIDPEVKGVVSSGFSGEFNMSEYQKYGFINVIEKPYKIEKLDEILVHIIGNKST